VRTELLLHESKSLSAVVRDFRLGCEISVIQAFADKIVGLLKVRDPLSERVHLSPLELLARSLGGIASEIARRAVGRRPVSKPAAGA
jgi:hydroxysqualene synthase